MYIKDRINPSQHGHRPGRGSATCWKEILENLPKYKYVYEFDFAKFHDQISRKWLTQVLISSAIPPEVVRVLVHLSSPYVRNTDPKDPLRIQMIPGFNYFHYYRGVVQGSNIAAYLGLLVLEHLGVYDLGKRTKYIGYADDGVLLSNDPKCAEKLESRCKSEFGIRLKPEKSGWVMKDGVWIKPLRLVGLSLEENGTLLKACTRSGKRSEIGWVNYPMEVIWNFLLQNDGILPESRTSRNPGTSLEKSKWVKGFADLGFLSSEA